MAKAPPDSVCLVGIQERDIRETNAQLLATCVVKRHQHFLEIRVLATTRELQGFGSKVITLLQAREECLFLYSSLDKQAFYEKCKFTVCLDSQFTNVALPFVNAIAMIWKKL